MRTSGALPLLLPALAAFYDAAPDEGRRRFIAHLAALDRLVKGGGEPSEAVLLGALLLHLPAGEPGAPSDRDRMLAELMATARLPRKIAERTRLALMSQRALRGPAKRRRRGLTAQTYFTDALQLLEITVQATGESASVLERWRNDERPGGSSAEPHPEADLEGELDLERSAPPGSDGTRGDGRGVRRGCQGRRARPQQTRRTQAQAAWRWFRRCPAGRRHPATVRVFASRGGGAAPAVRLPRLERPGCVR